MNTGIINTKTALRLFVAVVTLALALAGCGGGSGGGGAGGGGTNTIPSSPGAISAVAFNSQVSISWAPVTGATSYNLYWSTTSGVTTTSGTKIAGVSSTYIQTGLTNGTTYYYVLTAVNSTGESTSSPQASATPSSSSVSGFWIGGSLVGLAAGQSVILQNNAGDNLTVNANGTFTFPTSLASFSSYAVTVLTQPTNGQTCATISTTGAGTVALSNVDTVRLSCASVSTFAGSGVYGYGDATGEEATFYGASGAAVDSAGNLYIADTYSNVIRKITPAGVVATLAGSGKLGYVDGTSATAQFYFPTAGSGLGTGIAGVAVDGSGNVYVGDTLNNVIRKITPAGVVSTLAGSGVAGYKDATGATAQFNAPQGVAVDGSGNVYVADTNNSVIRKITSAGVVSTLAGTSGVLGYVDATGAVAQFRWPQGVAVDGSGNIYVADSSNYVIRKITPIGAVSTIVGSGNSGYLDATGTMAKFTNPQGITVDASGNMYVTDVGDNVVRIITPAGVVSTLAGKVVFGYSDGPITLAKFNYPMGIAVDGAGNVFVSDWSARRVRKISLKQYDYSVGGHVAGLVSGTSLVLQNNGGDNLTIGANGLFTFATPLTNVSGTTSYNVTILTQPTGQTCTVANTTGGFTVGDVLVVKVNCAAVSTLAGSGIAGFTNGTGAAAQFNISSNTISPATSGVATDASGNVYVADTYNNVIRKITPAGVVITFAGSGVAGFTNATGTSARFTTPRGVAVDGSGNVYVGDTGNNVIRKITSAGVVTTLAGSGVSGYTDASGTAAQFAGPIGVAVDGSGNVYVGDTNNSVIRKITSAGVVTTLAGSQASGSGYTNGTGTAARFWSPFGVAVDGLGNVYVADSSNHAIRKITAAGVVSTFAGSSEGLQNNGYLDSTGTGALFNVPSDVAVDASGTVYVADANNSGIRMINTLGTVTTLAGPATPVTGFTNGNGSTALFNVPAGIAVDSVGNVYVADCFNNAIRKIVQ